MVERYVAGETVKALAAEHGLHHQTIRAVLVEAGVLVRTRQRLTQKQLEEIVKLYESGLTTTEIGERLGVYASTVGRQLKKLGVELRAPGWRSSGLRG
ncbi:helix-turn-helix domain-containing protein [Nocardioides sp. TRM66260-LWL]|nr:helix-turn-helix domain-containing protein [Nocardioides sp. TRM66260-LWL]MBZ5735144.1 helix-turn-helix domain-containing protein [Nocardioides sp. TRM66260-LWL]